MYDFTPIYSPGDRVRVCSKEQMHDLYIPCVVMNEMYAFCDRVVTVQRCNPTLKEGKYQRFYIEEDGGQFFFDERLLTRYVPEITAADVDALFDMLGV